MFPDNSFRKVNFIPNMNLSCVDSLKEPVQRVLDSAAVSANSCSGPGKMGKELDHSFGTFMKIKVVPH